VRPVKFAVVGALNTLVDFIAFNVLATLLGVPVVPANVLSYSLGVLNSYAWNRAWTFGDRRSEHRRAEFVRFVAASAAGAGINTALVWGALALYRTLAPAGAPAPDGALVTAAAKALATVGSLVFNYTVFHRWVFVPAAPSSSNRVARR
jgi:putative flippase GtrA